jgi:prepilin-type N-terminal cleavage/methylation domain-containing protein
MTASLTKPAAQRGFSLLELAIVLIVFGLLAGGMLGNLSGQRRHSEEQRVHRQLDLTQEALYGFAITHGRLPCPANPTLDSDTTDAGTEDCNREHGVLPWRALGLSETDPWGQRLSYFVRQTFTTPPASGARAGFALDSIGNANIRPAANAGNKLADALPAVIVSHGANGLGGYRRNGQRTPAMHPDEAENSDADLVFVNRLPDELYDDQVIWLVPSILNSRLLAAGRLP